MSSILKALQKLEQERAAREGKIPDIGSRLAHDPLPQSTRRRWLLPGAIFLTALVAVAGTYALMGGFSPRRSDRLVTETLPAAPGIGTVRTDAGPAAAPRPAPPALPATRARSAPQAVVAPAAPEAVKSKPAAPAPAAPAAVPLPKAAAPPAAGHPSLSVSGIAWHAQGTLRLAVVNGLSVSEGSFVEGVKVEEILADRIRFSWKGESFEVPLAARK